MHPRVTPVTSLIGEEAPDTLGLDETVTHVSGLHIQPPCRDADKDIEVRSEIGRGTYLNGAATHTPEIIFF